jgi:hypothetical protein
LRGSFGLLEINDGFQEGAHPTHLEKRMIIASIHEFQVYIEKKFHALLDEAAVSM